MKTGLVLEGGASRTIFTCGILDAMLDRDVYINYLVGASAGISYGVSYLSKQSKRNIVIAQKYMTDRRYMGVSNLLDKNNRSYYGLDFVFGEIPLSLVPFDFEEYRRSGENGWGAVTDIQTGKTEYLRVSADDKDWTVLRASCALPLLFAPIELDGKLYMDGGITDSIPFQYAFDSGCDKLIVILTRPRGYVKQPEKLSGLIRKTYPKYPALSDAIEKRHIMYNSELEQLYELEKQGKVLILAPEKDYHIGRTERRPKKLLPFYKAGYDYAVKNMETIRAFAFPEE